MILNDELDMEMMRDIDERAFRPIYRVDFEDAIQKWKILKNFAWTLLRLLIQANMVYSLPRTGYMKRDARVEICRNYLEAKGASSDDFPNQRTDSASPRHEDLH